MTNLLSPKIQHQQKVLYHVLAPKEGTAVIHIILKCPLVAVHERRRIFWPSELSTFFTTHVKVLRKSKQSKKFLQNLLPILVHKTPPLQSW